MSDQTRNYVWACSTCNRLSNQDIHLCSEDNKRHHAPWIVAPVETPPPAVEEVAPASVPVQAPVKQTTVYLAGPMTGYVNHNAEEFANYAARYRSKGFRVISPPELDDGDFTRPYKEYIRRDMRVFLDEGVERVYLLPGWQKSRGAKLEKHVADMLGIPLYDAETGNEWSESIAQEAQRLVHGDRGATYSHPLDDFGRTVGVVNALLEKKLLLRLTEEDIAIIMVAVKLSRLVSSPDHRDSCVDLAGYAECYWMVREERERRNHGNQAASVPVS